MNLGTDDVGLTISAAGTTQATATLLIAGFNQITTAAAGSGCILNGSAASGASQLVYNAGANAVKIYPALGGQINSLPVNIGHVVAPNTACRYYFLTSLLVAAVLSA